MSKARAAPDFWNRGLAPSTELQKWFGHDPAQWQDFCSHYCDELKHDTEAAGTLRVLARKGPVTLLFDGRDGAHNEVVALREFPLGS